MKKFESESTASNGDRELTIAKLTKITGIARKTADAMYEIGIHNYVDLIKYLNQHTAEEFSAALKDHGVNRRPGLIDRELWIQQAEQHTRLEKDISSGSSQESQPEEQLEPAAAGRKPRKHSAMFTVSFDITKNGTGEQVLSTTVYNEGNGGEEGIFQGIDTAPWVNWILDRANLPILTMPALSKGAEIEEQPSIESQPASADEHHDVQFEISDVQLSVIESRRRTSETGFRTAMDIKLSGSGIDELVAQGAHFRTEVYTINLESGFPEQIGSCEERLKPNIHKYSHQVEGKMPRVGRYEIHSLVRLIPSGNLKAYHEGPILRVTP